MKQQSRVLVCPLCGFKSEVYQPSAQMWHGACPKKGIGKVPPEMKEIGGAPRK